MWVRGFHKRGVVILHVCQQVFFFSELFFLSTGKGRRKINMFFSLTCPTSFRHRKSPKFTCNIWCQAMRVLQDITLHHRNTFGNPSWSISAFSAVLTENFDLYLQRFPGVTLTQRVQKCVSRSPFQDPDLNTDVAYIKDADLGCITSLMRHSRPMPPSWVSTYSRDEDSTEVGGTSA